MRDIVLPFNHRIEPLLQNRVNYVVVKTDSLESIHQVLKLCDKYGYICESLETGIHRLEKKKGMLG